MTQFLDVLGDVMVRGGYVMIPLVVLSFVSVTLVIERTVFWMSVHGRNRQRGIAALNRALRAGDRGAVESLTLKSRSPYACLARRMLEQGASDAVAVEAIEDERRRLGRFMVTLSTIITAAPLLGILGTVLGIIQSFELLGGTSTLTDPTAVAGGIAAALLTTAFGLMIALVTLFPYMAFRGQVGQSLGRIESIVAAAQQGLGVPDEAVRASTAPKTQLEGVLA